MTELKSDPGVGDYYERKRRDAADARRKLHLVNEMLAAVELELGPDDPATKVLQLLAKRYTYELEMAEYVGD